MLRSRRWAGRDYYSTKPRAFRHARSHASSTRSGVSNRFAADSSAPIDVNAMLGGFGKPSNSAHDAGTDFDTVSTTAFGCIGK